MPEGELHDGHAQFDQLGQSIEYLNDEVVRDQVELIHDVVADAWLITKFGDHGIHDSPDVIIWRACQEGRTVLGRYIRAEPTQEPSDYLRILRLGYSSAQEEMGRQYDEWMKSKQATTPEDDAADNYETAD